MVNISHFREARESRVEWRTTARKASENEGTFAPRAARYQLGDTTSLVVSSSRLLQPALSRLSFDSSGSFRSGFECAHVLLLFQHLPEKEDFPSSRTDPSDKEERLRGTDEFTIGNYGRLRIGRH